MYTKKTLIEKWEKEIASHRKMIQDPDLNEKQKAMIVNHMAAILDCLTDLKQLNVEENTRPKEGEIKP